MNFNEFSDKISTLSTIKLGGRPSQFKVAPEIRKEFSEELMVYKNPKKAVVSALCYPDKNQKTQILLTERASYKGTHSGQISFVGGKIDGNETKQQALFREIEEEIGIDTSKLKLIRELSDLYIPPSDFLVYPFLCFLENTPKFRPNYEVAEILEIPLSNLLSAPISHKVLTTLYMKEMEVPYFKLNNKVVWGATAMILSEIRDLFNY